MEPYKVPRGPKGPEASAIVIAGSDWNRWCTCTRTSSDWYRWQRLESLVHMYKDKQRLVSLAAIGIAGAHEQGHAAMESLVHAEATHIFLFPLINNSIKTDP